MILINEIFGPTIQGEGKSVGKEVLFIRTSGCNLACSWCDTPYTWNWIGTPFVHPEKFDAKLESHRRDANSIFTELQFMSNVRSIVLSGGEPMLQQKQLLPLLRKLKENGYWVEVETNGTISPIPEFVALIDQINCSPKLRNSGPDNPLSSRLKIEALTTLSSLPMTTFKFVVSDSEDIEQILFLVRQFAMKEVYLMPLGKTKEEQLARQGEVEDLCARYSFNFSQRLHVLKWGTTRGV